MKLFKVLERFRK